MNAAARRLFYWGMPMLQKLAGLLARILATVCRKPAPLPPSSAPPPAPPKPLAGAARWLSFSARELGVKETPGPRSSPRVIEYRRIAGCGLEGDDGSVPWCRIYVCAMFKLAGLPYRADWMARSVERDPYFVRLPGPALGAVCSFWRGSRAGGLGHTGFYRGETADKVLVEGGNESDAVRRAFYPKNGVGMGLVGYYWPKDVSLPAIGAIEVDDDGDPLASAA
jgi:uncharacterized protein (TIGR02594 family)